MCLAFVKIITNNKINQWGSHTHTHTHSNVLFREQKRLLMHMVWYLAITQHILYTGSDSNTANEISNSNLGSKQKSEQSFRSATVKQVKSQGSSCKIIYISSLLWLGENTEQQKICHNMPLRNLRRGPVISKSETTQTHKQCFTKA